MSPLLVPVGDPAGIGPSIAVRAALAVSELCPIVLIGDGARLQRLLGRQENITITDTGAVSDGAVSAHAATEEGGRAQLAALDRAIDLALEGVGRAVVTGPVCKAAIHRSGTSFIGQTEHLARRCGLEDDAVTMMFFGPRLSVALATTHLAIRELSSKLRRVHVTRAITHLGDALSRLSADAAPIIVTGLNPHAGEEGLFGDEDSATIAPALEAMREAGFNVEGPIGAETAFRRAAAGEVGGVVAMFHDQATIASKLLDWGDAVNVTWGLPFVRTSVDHGVAYDAARRGDSSARSMEAALTLAHRLTADKNGSEDA